MFLCECTDSVSILTGVGPKALQSYSDLGIKTIADLIEFRPRAYEDRSSRICIGCQFPDGPLTNTFVTVESVSSFGSGLKNVKAKIRDTENGVGAVLLGFNRPFLKKTLYSGSVYRLYGDAVTEGKSIQFSQFEIERVRDEDLIIHRGNFFTNQGILAVYSLCGSLTQKAVRKDMANALSRCSIDNDIPSDLMDKYALTDLDRAFREIHRPSSVQEMKQALRTLSFREAFFMQLSVLRRTSEATVSRKRPPKTVYGQETEFINSLPFKLTSDQENVLDEIRTDMACHDGMNRLLQGDVGSGKTLVAWVSAIHAVCQGVQVAFMAPTELLARQHASNAAILLEKTGINVAYLDGEVQGKSRQLLLNQLKAGNIDLIIGTHSLFSNDVVYRNLGYVIIDEQHRFGVEQRSSLASKGQNPDILLMTATPIPRTLALTVFGDLEVSSIRTMPAGRLPVVTYLVPESRRNQMYDSVETELGRGHQAYFVYPRIENSDSDNLRDVCSMFDYLSHTRYPQYRGALIHSKIDDSEKMKILRDFSSGKIRFLCATSVVEVGIDVANATCMVIEHADIFGLSALHQLRGRVGRSTLQSWCFLVFGDGITEDGKQRLGVLRRTCDGFEIAQEDLKIRGPGELSGSRQSGFLHMKFADLEKDIDLIACARKEAQAILESNPDFSQYSCRT